MPWNWLWPRCRASIGGSGKAKYCVWVADERVLRLAQIDLEPVGKLAGVFDADGRAGDGAAAVGIHHIRIVEHDLRGRVDVEEDRAVRPAHRLRRDGVPEPDPGVWPEAPARV